jgi:hypothetical protein
MENISENSNEYKGKIDKARMFKEERENIIRKINDILKLKNEENAFIWLNDISQEQIKEVNVLLQYIKKYYTYGGWSFLKKQLTDIDMFIGIIKNVYKSTGYRVTINTHTFMKHGINEKRKKIAIEKLN